MRLQEPEEQLEIWHIPVTPPELLPEPDTAFPSQPGLERAEAAEGDTEGSSLPGRLCLCHCKTHPNCIAVKSPSLADFALVFPDIGCIKLQTSI